MCRELTKLHEEVVRGSARTLLERFQGGARGEITLVIEGRGSRATSDAQPSAEELDRRIVALLADGLSTRDAAAQLARETGQKRQEIYARIEAHKARGRDGA